jgi:VanZ family protein
MKKIAYFLPSLALYALIFLVSSQSLGFSVPGQWLDKIPHALVYGAMGFLLSLGFFHVLPSSAGLAVVLSFLSGSVLGALDEVHQKYTRGRVSDPKDAVADAIGVAVGIAVYWYLRRKRPRSTGP